MNKSGGTPLVLPAQLLKKQTDRLNPAIEVRDMKFLIGRVQIVIGQAEAHHHEIFKRDTVFIRSGGSIPIVTDFQDVVKIRSAMMGFGVHYDNLHAPNAQFNIAPYY